MAPGDIAYFPESVAHAVRNPSSNGDDLHVVTQITPPQLDLYEPDGYYHRAQGALHLTAAYRAALNAPRHEMPVGQMTRHDTDPGCRAEHLSKEEVRREGALFNVELGTPFPGLGIPAHLVLWPGAGCRTAGFNYALAPALATDAMHVHPVSDECLVVWEGVCEGYTAHGYTDTGSPDLWTGRETSFVALETYDVILAPCGVLHGHRSVDTPSVLGGFASPLPAGPAPRPARLPRRRVRPGVLRAARPVRRRRARRPPPRRLRVAVDSLDVPAATARPVDPGPAGRTTSDPADRCPRCPTRA
ncbi:MAG: hypothetical protein R2726_00810 [Acidimicrobiales bacterium]